MNIWIGSLSLLICFAAIPTSRIFATDLVATTASPTPTANPAFASIIPTLVAGTKVPVILPYQFPSISGALYATITNVSAASYAVELDRDPNCLGAHACYEGFVAGYSGKTAPAISGSPTILANGKTAYFTPTECGGAGCSDAILIFKIASSVYIVGRNAGKVDQLLVLANSMQSVP